MGRQTEQQFLQLAEKASYQVLKSNGIAYTLKKPFGEYVKPELLPGIDTVLGIPCKKAKAIIRSNTIEIWYTNDLEIKGSPNITIAPGLGLVLKIVRNGNSETFAKHIEYRKVTNEELGWPAQWGKIVDEPTYQRQVIESRYTTLTIFDREQISFGNEFKNPEDDQRDVTYHFSGGTVILKKVNLAGCKARPATVCGTGAVLQRRCVRPYRLRVHDTGGPAAFFPERIEGWPGCIARIYRPQRTKNTRAWWQRKIICRRWS